VTRPDRPYTFHGRRRGRRLRPQRAALTETLLPRLTVSLPPGAAPFDPRTLFDTPVREVWLEIGFGGGEHLAWQAAHNPEVGIIGAEPYLEGVGKLISTVDREGLRNVRIRADDVRPLLDDLAARAPASLARIFDLFPDPWPKARHAKRRLISRANLIRFAELLADGGELRIASDDPGTIRAALLHGTTLDAFAWLAAGPADWRQRPPDWPQSRYEAKALEAGRECVFLRFRRRARKAG
jgi:tRNA (guanine-N7-)-methyltransferase